MITKLSIIGKILLIEYDSFLEMRKAAWRISEFYEGKDGIRGQHFNIHTFLDLHLDENGDLNTWNFWEGYNFPKKQVLQFEGKFFKDISPREEKLIAACSRIPDDGYVILCKEGDEITKKHELCHGLYFTNNSYYLKASLVIGSIPLDIFLKFESDLLKMGYTSNFIGDEMQAYLTAYDEAEFKECFPSVQFEEVREYSEILNRIYDAEVSNTR